MIANTHSLTEKLAQHLLREICPDMRNRARLHMLDWMGCAAAARTSEIAGRLRNEPLASRMAMLGNVLEMDDVHRSALLHPGPVIWPTALDNKSASMDLRLDAAVRGYEAMIAIGETFDAHHYAHFHPTATAGIFGAAVTKAALANMSGEEIVAALGLAGSVTGGLWQMRHEPGEAKQWHVAHAVMAGSHAAGFAQNGLKGPRFILEGPQGVQAAMTREPKPMHFPNGWRIEEVSFKPWAACRHAHPAIDAALELRAAGLLTPPFHVATYADAITFCDRPDPLNELDAKFSLQHAIAVVADGRDAAPGDFRPDVIGSLAPLRAQVTVIEDPAITACYPAHFGAKVTAAGASVALADTRGDPERPLPRDGVIAKARTLFECGGLDATQAERGVTLALESDDAPALLSWLEDVL